MPSDIRWHIKLSIFIFRFMNKLIIYVCPAVIFMSCGPGQHAKNNTTQQDPKEIIHITDHTPQSRKLVLEKIDSVVYRSHFSTVGTVKAIPSQIAEIATPFDGRMIRSFVTLGQRVKAGDPIFELNSTEFHEAAKSYFQAFQNKQLAERNQKRQRDLVQHGVGTQRELEEAEATYESELKEYERASAYLKIFNVNPEQLTMGQPLKVYSPISGEVVQNNMVIGQYVKSDGAPAAIVAELNKVWVVAQVKERQIGLIHSGDDVVVRTEAMPEMKINGSIYHIQKLLDEDTRSIQVLVECSNEQHSLKPGMFANVEFISTPHKMIIIPATAILQSENGSYVFLQKAPGEYIKRFIKPAAVDEDEVVILEGLQVGDVIISDGGIFLESAN